MLKKGLIIFLLLFARVTVQAQSAGAIYNLYLDFNLARLEADQDKALELGETILPNADLLPEKARTSFYFGAGKMYEDNSEPDKALPLYEKVAAAAPNYYVVHRALGYLYYEKARQVKKQMDAATDKTMLPQLTAAYRSMVITALPHLEKAQACDPSDETLAIIKTLYQSITDAADQITLYERLKQMSKNCVDILPDR